MARKRGASPTLLPCAPVTCRLAVMAAQADAVPTTWTSATANSEGRDEADCSPPTCNAVAPRPRDSAATYMLPATALQGALLGVSSRVCMRKKIECRREGIYPVDGINAVVRGH